MYLYTRRLNKYTVMRMFLCCDEQADKGISTQSGSEEFESLIPHLPTMGLQRVSWKHYAKTQQLLVKEFVDFKTANALFDFTLMNGDTEQRLSQLCFLVCEATEKNTPFMLKLPNKTINTHTGQQHKLAMFSVIMLI